MAGLGVDLSIDDHLVLNKEISFTDLLKDLDMVAQGRVEAQRGAHGVAVDLFNVQLSKSGVRPAQPVPGAVLDTEVSMTLLEIGGIFDPRGDRQGLSFTYGARILAQSAAIDARFEAPLITDTERHEANDTLVDGLLGVRFAGPSATRWSYLLAADVSSGGTKLTWSGSASLSYAFSRSGRYALSAGYKHMSVRFETQSPTRVDMTLSGFSAGLRVNF
jgi:hypothetical protein